MTRNLVRHDLLKSVLAHAILVLVVLSTFAFFDQNSAERRFLKGTSETIELSLARISQPAQKAIRSSESGVSPSQKIKAVSEAQTAQSAVAGMSGTFGRVDGIEVNARERYIAELQAWIEQNKVYPAISRKLRETGQVSLHFTLMKNGQIERVEVKNGASFERLNQAAVTLVRDLSRFKPFPSEVNQESLSVDLAVNYTLE